MLGFELSPDNLGDHRVRSRTENSKADESLDESKREVIEVTADPVDNRPVIVSRSRPDSLAHTSRSMPSSSVRPMRFEGTHGPNCLGDLRDCTQ